MQTKFDPALARVLVYEGGLSNNPKDPGGLTNKGITQGTYNSWRARQGLPQQTVANITDVEVATIYKLDYWDRTDCDELPAGVDFCMFDAAVNSGVGGATEWAQAVCGIDTDGDFGPKTKAAIIAMDPETFIREFCSRRLGTLQRLRTWSTFGKGWAARVTNVQKTALAWAQAGEGPDPVSVHTIGGHTKAKPADVPTSKVGQIAAHATTIGGAVGTAATQATTSLTGVGDIFAWMKYVLAGITILGAIAGIIVYISKQANDAASSAMRKAVVDPDADAEVPSVPLKPAVVVTASATIVAATETVVETKHG